MCVYRTYTHCGHCTARNLVLYKMLNLTESELRRDDCHTRFIRQTFGGRRCMNQKRVVYGGVGKSRLLVVLK